MKRSGSFEVEAEEAKSAADAFFFHKLQYDTTRFREAKDKGINLMLVTNFVEQLFENVVYYPAQTKR